MTNQPAHPKADESHETPSPASSAKESRKVGYESPEYVKARQRVLDIIPSLSVWDSIDRYAGHIALGLFGLAFGSIFKSDNPNALDGRTTKLLGGTAIGTALLGLYAHYQKRMISEPASIAHMEAYKTAETQLIGQSLANALEAKFPHANQPSSCQPGCACPQHGPQTEKPNMLDKAKEELTREWGSNILAKKQEAETTRQTGNALQ